MKALATLLSGLLVVTVVACIILVLSARLSGLHWTLDFVGQFQLPALWVLIVAAVLLVAFMPLSKARFLNLPFANLAVIFAALGWFWVWPDSMGEPAPGAITVYQHNIWGNHPNPERAAAGALASDADIAAFVEGYDEVLRPSGEALDARWPYNTGLLLRGQSAGGLKLYSRYEIISVDAKTPNNTPAMLEARLRLPDGELTVLVIHFTRPWPFDDPHAQLRQLEGLAEKISEIEGPLIMLGDVNSAAWGRIARPLQSELGFHLVSDPRAGTWPSRAPIKFDVPSIDWPSALAIPIDLAFCRGSLVCANHRVGDHFGSDHRSASFEVSLGAGTGD